MQSGDSWEWTEYNKAECLQMLFLVLYFTWMVLSGVLCYGTIGSIGEDWISILFWWLNESKPHSHKYSSVFNNLNAICFHWRYSLHSSLTDSYNKMSANIVVILGCTIYYCYCCCCCCSDANCRYANFWECPVVMTMPVNDSQHSQTFVCSSSSSLPLVAAAAVVIVIVIWWVYLVDAMAVHVIIFLCGFLPAVEQIDEIFTFVNWHLIFTKNCNYFISGHNIIVQGEET